jgi:protein-S-isoprenylcysteine O-methyltransferase Ste14
VSEETDNPGVIAFPPALFAGTLLAGLVLDRFVRAELGPRWLTRLAAATLVAKGVGLAAWGGATMKRSGTNIDVEMPALVLVESGPFAYTRNPLYLSMALAYAGIATWRRAPVALALLPALLIVVQRGVIEREERYLTKKFGERYLAYKSRVRRWL